MAQKVNVELIDDLDGSKAVETVNFALEGKAYEIDLNAKNAAALRTALKKYIDAGRSAGRASSNGGARVMNLRWTKAEYAKAREWLTKNGKKLPPRGRISNTYMEEWEKAGKK